MKNLNDYQADDRFHPFTSMKGGNLIATEAGWVEVDGGPIVQTWAYDLMLDGSWRALFPDRLVSRART